MKPDRIRAGSSRIHTNETEEFFMKQLNIKTPLMFSIVVTLLSALLITSHMVSGLYAKYSTTASGSSSARVATIS